LGGRPFPLDPLIRLPHNSASPEHTHAVIIGIEKYDEGEAFNLDGPINDALAIHDWLSGRGVPEGQIHLHVSALSRNQSRLQGAGGNPQDATEQALRKTLLQLRDLPACQAELLIIYWAGHGVSHDGRDYLLLSTATKKDIACYTVENIRASFASADCLGFPQQIFFFDACRSFHRNPTISPSRQDLPEGKAFHKSQFLFFACQQGYAASSYKQGEAANDSAKEKNGLFTKLLLDCLQAQSQSKSAWPPDMDTIAQQVNNSFRERNNDQLFPSQTPVFYCIDWEGNRQSHNIREVDISFLDPIIDNVDDKKASNMVKQVITEMAQPGGIFSQRLADVNLSLFTTKARIKHKLRELLAAYPQSSIEEFRQKLGEAATAGKEINSISFLLIIVDPDFEPADCYKFRAELIKEKSMEPFSFDAGREPDGKWPEGRIDILPKLLGKWLHKAKEMMPNGHRLYMEIFLPHKLLTKSPRLTFKLPYDEEGEVIDLAACGIPFVLRSFDRVQMAKKTPMTTLHSKWEGLRQGSAKIHSVSQESQLETGLLHSRLSRNEVAVLSMLLNLPPESKKRELLFWMIINSEIPHCAWWRDRHEADPELEEHETETDRLEYLCKCLCLDEVESDPKDKLQADAKSDLNAPQHLHAMEKKVAEKRLYLAGEEECKGWIGRLMLLMDHPKRWPTSIRYEHEEGGFLKNHI
jgi:hypothetical protein